MCASDSTYSTAKCDLRCSQRCFRNVMSGLGVKSESCGGCLQVSTIRLFTANRPVNSVKSKPISNGSARSSLRRQRSALSVSVLEVLSGGVRKNRETQAFSIEFRAANHRNCFEKTTGRLLRLSCKYIRHL